MSDRLVSLGKRPAEVRPQPQPQPQLQPQPQPPPQPPGGMFPSYNYERAYRHFLNSPYSYRTFSSLGTVSVTESSSTDLAGVNTAADINLTNLGIAEGAGATLAVTGTATLSAASLRRSSASARSASVMGGPARSSIVLIRVLLRSMALYP